MAKLVQEEIYTNATIDAAEQTVTEYHGDGVRVYGLAELLDRWSGVSGVSISIRAEIPIIPMAEEG